MGSSIQRDSKTIYFVPLERSDIFLKITASDTLVMNVWRTGKICIESYVEINQKYVLENEENLTGENSAEAVSNLKAKHGENLSEEKLGPAEPTEQKQTVDLNKKIKNYKKYFDSKKLSTIKSASVFLKLLKEFQTSSRQVITNVLKNEAFKPILPQILDVVAFVGSPEAIQATFETLDFENDDPDVLERYLLGLSLLPRPATMVAKYLLLTLEKPLTNEKIVASLLSTLGAVIRKMKDIDSQETEKVRKQTIELLEKRYRLCVTNHCRIIYIRGYRNAAQKSSIGFLSEIAISGGEVALEALLSLKNAGIQRFPSQCESVARTVFHELRAKQETSSRIIAADLLIDCHTNRRTIRELLQSLLNKQENEFSDALYAWFVSKVDSNQKLRSEIQAILQEEGYGFFPFFQHRSSVYLEKPLISSSMINSSYGISLEMRRGGLLKRSSFDVIIHTFKEKLPLLSVGMFAGGLDTLAGGATGNEVVKAGMELTVLGVALRPYLFFEGMSELMGHVWSGTASEPIPALQGNFKIFGVSETYILQNGLIARMELDGAISVDLSASVQISIWNRDSLSKVENKVAVVESGVFSVGPQPFHFHKKNFHKGELSLDFITNLDFYEVPFKMCLRMSQPGFTFWKQEENLLSLNNSKFYKKRKKTKKYFIPPKSFHIHQKNSDTCTTMLS